MNWINVGNHFNKTSTIKYKLTLHTEKFEIFMFNTYDELIEKIYLLKNLNVDFAYYSEKITSESLIKNGMVGGTNNYEILDKEQILKDLNKYKRKLKLKRILDDEKIRD